MACAAASTPGEGEFWALSEREATRRIEAGVAWFRAQGWPLAGFVAPAWLLGPDDHAPSASGRTYRAVAAGQIPAVPAIPLQATDSRDAAAACVAAVDRDVRGRFIVAGERTDLHAVAVAMARAGGARPPARLPMSWAVPATAAAERLARLTHQPPVSTTEGTRVLIGDSRNAFDARRARAELGVTCRPLGETVGDLARWFADQG